jgi:aminoglycoside phosphotransferase (APT) family kinase protein
MRVMSDIPVAATTEGRPEFDERRLDTYLRAQLESYDGPYSIRSLVGGQSNPTFLLEGRSHRLVLRKQPDGALLPSAHAIDREFQVTRALIGTDVPVPHALCFCTDASIIGTPFYLMDFVSGRQYVDPALPGLHASERTAIWREINRVVAALHLVDYDAVGLGTYGRPGNYFERQIARWSRQYRASETERIESMELLMEWLPLHVPASDETALVHGDLRIDNLLFDPVEPRVIAVLDWELSTLGHPLADLSYHVMSWRLTAEQFRGMAGNDFHALGIPDEAEYVRMYCERTGRGGIDASEWEFHMTFSMFRLAAILQGIVKRAIKGNASSDQALATGRRARTIADIAWQQVVRLG